MITLPQSQIDDEVTHGYKPHAVAAGLSMLPLNELGDREFEMLVYSLIEARIKVNDYESFDQVVLMKGVGERGRDCLLYRQGHVAGLVQCKKLQKKMSRPEVMEEIIKFLMFALSEDELIPKPEAFEYHLYASGGYFETAVTLLSSFSLESRLELKSGSALRIIQNLKEKYSTFRAYDEQIALEYVGRVLGVLTVKYYAGYDLNLSLASYPVVLSKFFRTMPVLDPTTFEEILTQTLQSSGIKFLTDENLNALYKRLSSVPPEFQVALGNVDFYGYSEEYFKFLGKEGFSELIKKVSEVRLFLDLKAHDFAASLIMPEILEKLTKPYVHTGRVLPYSLNVIAQYLVKRILPTVMSRASPGPVLDLMHPHLRLTKQALMDSILEECLESSRRFFAGDYSGFPDPDPDREKRIALFVGMHAECKTDVQLKERFQLDIPQIMQIVDEIERTIIAAVPQVRTVVINDMAYFDEPEKLKQVFTTLQTIA
ncbi:hypothetical protein [Pseudomonas cerasi]